VRITFIRHCEPDYSIDSLTKKGWREAELLAERLLKMEFKDIYCSPLGRARDTAKVYLERAGRSAETKDWLREFLIPIDDPKAGKRNYCWDFLPSYWTVIPEMYDRDKWTQTSVMKNAGVLDHYRRVANGLDEILAEHGYIREGNFYRVERSNKDELAFFCHFGVTCVMLSHLTGTSPMIYWHHFVAAPSSLTTLVTEEREEGIATFRCMRFGDVAHLYAAGEEPSFSARFEEVFGDIVEWG